MSLKINTELLSNPITFNTKLAASYILDFEKTKDFFAYPPYNFKIVEDVINQHQTRNYPRNEIYNILSESYKNSTEKKIWENIELFRKNTTFAIVTGQQPDLLTGPLFIIYKAISAVKLAEKIKNIFPDYNFVPVFWVNSEDHDIDEINHAYFINKDFNINKFSFDIKPARTPIYKINLSYTDINYLKTYLENNLNHTEYTEKLITIIDDISKQTLNINQFFIILMKNFFNQFGLIVLDGSDINLKKIGKEIFRKEIDNNEILTGLVKKNGDLLEKYGFHKQVNLTQNFCNFFVEENNKRCKVEYKNNKFLINSNEYSTSELIARLEKNPEIFSPNVILRPIFQDYLLPTIIYLAGPGEISYYAQFVKNGYKNYNLNPPIIWPRISTTIIENSSIDIMKKHNLDFNMIISQKNNSIINSIIKNKYDYELKTIIDEYKSIHEKAGNKLSSEIKKIFPDLLNALNKMNNLHFDEIGKFENRILQKIKANEEITLRQLTKLFNQIYPEEEFQERKINIFYYLNKYGENFIDCLYQSLIIDKPGHNILKIG